ncbi:MAG: DUF4258 domain-containing protein [Dehalococcoidia bacterium]|nr:DUF4258 domain-containing protein [Dehalococcoidia bacterium]
MRAREIRAKEVREALRRGEIIEDYPNDVPLPSCLILASVEGRPLHVVAAFDDDRAQAVIITAYLPDPAEWSEDFRRRL